MKTHLLLWGMAGTLSVATLDSGAQDAEQPTSPPPAASSARKSKDASAKTTGAAANDPQLLEKLKLAGANLSAPVLEIVKMSDAGTDSEVMHSFVENSPVAYNLRPNEIIYLHDHGISKDIITAMIQHGAKLREQSANSESDTSSHTPTSPAPAASSAPTYAVQPAAFAYVSSPAYAYPAYAAAYPSYAYTYPSYYYSYPAYSCLPYYGFSFSFSRPFYYGHSFYGRPFYRTSFAGGYRPFGVYGHSFRHRY